MQKPIESFIGEFRFLSNFYMCRLNFNGLPFLCAEGAYQAAKCENISDREKFSSLSGGDAKRLGRKVLIRKDWGVVKVGFMTRILREKFSNPDLKRKLLATGKAMLIEGNTWGDTFWGVCNGEGQNNLGMLLMQIRKELHKGCR